MTAYNPQISQISRIFFDWLEFIFAKETLWVDVSTYYTEDDAAFR